MFLCTHRNNLLPTHSPASSKNRVVRPPTVSKRNISITPASWINWQNAPTPTLDLIGLL